MARLVSQNQLRDALERAGALRGVVAGGVPGPADILSAIAMVEGANYNFPGYCDLDVIGDLDRAGEVTPNGTQHWGPSVTPWQIRTIQEEMGSGSIRDRAWLVDNIDNAARGALTVYRQQGYNAWTVYRDGKHKAYLPEFYPPAPGKYVVVSGDNFTKINAKLGLPRGTMERYTGKDPRNLQIGWELDVPFMELTVQAGDTVSRLMRLAGWTDPLRKADTDRVIKFAGLTSSAIRAGQKLRILRPGTEWLVL